MVETTTIPKKYVRVQATQPSSAVEGDLWYDSTTDNLYSYDGSKWNSVFENIDYLRQISQENAINILINSASASSTLKDWEDMYLDIFTDSDGLSNTIDTGNTDAIFSTNLYQNFTLSDTIDNTNFSLYVSNSTTNKQGVQFTVNQEGMVTVKANFVSGYGGTKAYLYNDNAGNVGSLIETVDINTGVATFNQNLTNGNVYWILADAEGASYTGKEDNSHSYPVAGTNVTYNASYSGSKVTNKLYAINSLTTTISTAPSKKIVQTDSISITANPNGHQVFCHKTLQGTGSVTYDISFDGGSTWITDQELDTKNTSVHAGSSMILKLNLNGSGIGNSSKASDYAIMLFY